MHFLPHNTFVTFCSLLAFTAHQLLVYMALLPAAFDRNVILNPLRAYGVHVRPHEIQTMW